MEVFTPEFINLLDPATKLAVLETSAATMLDLIKQLKPTSQAKGQQGEAWVYELIKHRMPECEVVKCASSKWSGDFQLRRTIGARTVTLLIDVKNYSNVVSRDEIHKFHRDMEIRKADAGMLLSLGTRFAGQPAEDGDMAFSTMSYGGRDIQTVLLNSCSETTIVHALRYLFSLTSVEQQVKINENVVRHLNDVRARLAQLSRLRYEIQLLNSTVSSSLNRLSHDVLDIEVRTQTLLDSIFQNIDQQSYQLCRAEHLEQDLGCSLRDSTLKLLLLVKQEVRVSEDKKYITLGRLATITRMAVRDRITITVPAFTKAPWGEFQYKKDQLTFDLDAPNLELAAELIGIAPH